MLVLTRRHGESLRIGPDIRVTVVSSTSGQVRIAIDAPEHVGILREEILSEWPRQTSRQLLWQVQWFRSSAPPRPDRPINQEGIAMSEVIRFESRRVGTIEVGEADIVSFDPLPGFPNKTRFVVVEHADSAEFAWLVCLDDPDLAFVVASPWTFFPTTTRRSTAIIWPRFRLRRKRRSNCSASCR